MCCRLEEAAGGGGIYAGAAEEETGKEVGDRLKKRESDDSGEKPGRPAWEGNACLGWSGEQQLR